MYELSSSGWNDPRPFFEFEIGIFDDVNCMDA